MALRSNYVMRDQVRELVPSIMEYDVTRDRHRSETPMHLLAVAVVTAVYLLAMAISG